jgi:phospholipid N-methyltransferase
MGQQSRLLTIEKTETFMTALDQIADDRLINELGDASNLSRILTKYSIPSPDVIVSGIPFSSIAPQVGSQIIAAIHRSLAPGGTFIAYQLRNHVQDLSRSLFGNPTVELIPLNIPPLRVFTWEKVRS